MWTFLNSAFLWAGLAAMLPLMLHLLQRRRIVRVPFSTLRFLKLAEKKSTSRIRLENFLLWLLRTLLLIFLVLAFAGPVMRAAGLGRWAGASRRDIAIVLDDSASMRYESGFLKVWPAAVQTAADLIQGLSPGDRVTLFLARENAVPLIEQPSGDFELALSLLRAQEPGAGVAHLKAAFRAACNSLKESGRREKELYVLTDGQDLSWSDFRNAETGGGGATNAPADPWKPDPQIALFGLLAGSETPENAYPLSLDIDPLTVRAGQPARLKTIVGFSGPARATSATLLVDDKEEARRTVNPGDGGRQEVLFTLPPLPAGRHILRVELPPDPLAMDDAFHAVVVAHDQLPVLAVGRPQDLFFLSRALNPGGADSALDVRTVQPDALDAERLAGFACLFLCNAVPLSGQSLVAVEQYIRNGGVAVIFPGDRGAPADYESWSCLPAKPLSIRDQPPQEAARLLRLLKPDDPLFAGLHLPPGSTPALAVQRRLAFGTLEKDAETVIGMGDDAPFLLARPFGRGRILFCSVSADRAWSTLPLSPFFLPLVHRIALYGTGTSASRLYVFPAPLQDVTDFVSAFPGDLNLLSPAGALLPVRRVQEDKREACVVDNLAHTGIYRLASDNAPVLAVNLSRIESDLTPVRAADLARIPALSGLFTARSREELLQRVKEHRIGTPLAELFLWLALLTAILESLLAARAVRRSPRLSDRMTLEPSGRLRGTGTDGEAP
jgi:hypothetical protein